MNYQQLTINTNKDNAYFIEEVALGLGALSVDFTDTFDDPILEPKLGTTPLWENVTITLLFAEEVDKNAVLLALQQICQITGEWSEVEEKNWQEECNKNFTATQYGNNVWICPSWEDCSHLSGMVITMDPGMAFGTGSHQTTSLCLEYLANNPPLNKTVLDFGTGSGILAIAAKKLGATRVVATDNDPQSIISTQENSKHNDTKLEIVHSDEFKTQEFDVVVANILTNTLIELAELLQNCVKNGGKIIMSGILATQKEEILQTYSPHFADFVVKQKDDWLLITATKD